MTRMVSMAGACWWYAACPSGPGYAAITGAGWCGPMSPGTRVTQSPRHPRTGTRRRSATVRRAWRAVSLGVPAWFGRSTLQWWALAGGQLVAAPSAEELASLLGRLLDHPPPWPPAARDTACEDTKTARAAGREQRPGILARSSRPAAPRCPGMGGTGPAWPGRAARARSPGDAGQAPVPGEQRCPAALACRLLPVADADSRWQEGAGDE